MSIEFADLVGQVVVVDTDGPVLYIGKLVEIGAEFLVIEDVDVHNLGDSATGRELYLINAKQFGVRPNRKKAQVRTARVVGLSKLEDVIEF